MEDNNYNYVNTMYGQIITDEKYAGKMFVNGLPIFKDSKFKYGYNFKPQYVNLDRDRKSINIRDLKRITALAITYMENPDFNLVDYVIEGGKSNEDAEYIKDNCISLNENFIDGYSKHLKEKFDIDNKTVVVQETSKELIDEIKKKQKSEDIKLVIVPNKIYADVINRRSDYSSNFLNDLHNEINHRSEIEDAWYHYEWSNYKKFRDWLEKYHTKLPNEATNEFFDILSNIEPIGFKLIEGELNE